MSLDLPLRARAGAIEDALVQAMPGHVYVYTVEGERIARVVNYDRPDTGDGFAFGEVNLSRIARRMEAWLS